MDGQYPPLSQRRLARETNLSPTTINLIYLNKFNRIDNATIEKLCDYFGVEIGELLYLEEAKD
ncbi:helix-turn-helix transcriptional regulator [Gloeocapsopsis crepidinum LEGE 06123]|uniref:Helix-turn-helix transcriptional regulator n=1 Tax=Gloeocapsopsis crepidinum LEGE 06123 TaxID=588587 RepID=A0ABR9UQR4_9CHRO|nr:helix-turn-helix transcriptional regulator [Gloeocapsopsis crepidinum LEGE 06123]